MIYEIAKILVKDGEEEGFKLALNEAKKVISLSRGFLGIEFTQGIETPNEFILLIQWETLEDHTIGFRESELFVKWRAIIGPFFKEAPVVFHYNPFNNSL